MTGRLTLIQNNGREIVIDVRKGESVTIGRGKACDVRILDTRLSRIHCKITEDEGSFFIVDAGSMNGTFVNREKVERAELSDGDEVMIGTNKGTFRMVPDEEAAREKPFPSLVFCDECNGSIPRKDLEAGTAREENGKYYCRTCLAAREAALEAGMEEATAEMEKVAGTAETGAAGVGAALEPVTEDVPPVVPTGKEEEDAFPLEEAEEVVDLDAVEEVENVSLGNDAGAVSVEAGDIEPEEDTLDEAVPVEMEEVSGEEEVVEAEPVEEVSAGAGGEAASGAVELVEEVEVIEEGNGDAEAVEEEAAGSIGEAGPVEAEAVSGEEVVEAEPGEEAAPQHPEEEKVEAASPASGGLYETPPAGSPAMKAVPPRDEGPAPEEILMPEEIKRAEELRRQREEGISPVQEEEKPKKKEPEKLIEIQEDDGSQWFLTLLGRRIGPIGRRKMTELKRKQQLGILTEKDLEGL